MLLECLDCWICTVCRRLFSACDREVHCKPLSAVSSGCGQGHKIVQATIAPTGVMTTATVDHSNRVVVHVHWLLGA